MPTFTLQEIKFLKLEFPSDNDLSGAEKELETPAPELDDMGNPMPEINHFENNE